MAGLSMLSSGAKEAQSMHAGTSCFLSIPGDDPDGRRGSGFQNINHLQRPARSEWGMGCLPHLQIAEMKDADCGLGGPVSRGRVARAACHLWHDKMKQNLSPLSQEYATVLGLHLTQGRSAGLELIRPTAIPLRRNVC